MKEKYNKYIQRLDGFIMLYNIGVKELVLLRVVHILVFWSRWRMVFTAIAHQNTIKFEKVGGTNDMSRWRNRPAPPLVDNTDYHPITYVSRIVTGQVTRTYLQSLFISIMLPIFVPCRR